MCPDAPRQVPEPLKETVMEPQPAHLRDHKGSPFGDFQESVSSRKQTCPWMHSRAPAAQEDTCTPAKQGPPAQTCHTSHGDAAAVHRAPTAALCVGPHSAPENGLHQMDRSCWSSRFLTAPSFLPPEKPGPAQGPPATHMSDGACVCGPWSVLHGDLQVSSSSEDTESE